MKARFLGDQNQDDEAVPRVQAGSRPREGKPKTGCSVSVYNKSRLFYYQEQREEENEGYFLR